VSPLWRRVILVATSASAAASLLYLQARFDASDEKNALTIVQTYRAHSGKSLPDVVAQENAGRVPEWSARTESSCFGHERVRAQLNAESGVVTYDFLVDINGPSIHPGNENGRRALEALGP
jgi:hypothetical protein